MADVIEPPDQGEWPMVASTGPPPPATSVAVEDGTVLVEPPRVIAHGRVAGIPWKIQAWTTGPAPGAKWWDVMEPVGPGMEFELGAGGFLGGGRVHVRVPEAHAFTASGHFFGRAPFLIAWAGSVSELVKRLQVSLADGRTRDIPLHEGPEGFPRLFWFFPPRGVSAGLIAHAADDGLVRSELDEWPLQAAHERVPHVGHARLLAHDALEERESPIELHIAGPFAQTCVEGQDRLPLPALIGEVGPCHRDVPRNAARSKDTVPYGIWDSRSHGQAGLSAHRRRPRAL